MRQWKIHYTDLRTSIFRFGYPIVFATISGSDLYGFPSDDGDFAIRGSHVVSNESLWLSMLSEGGMDKAKDLTIEHSDGDVDLVSHDIAKSLKLALKGNGCVLEQIISPLVLATSEWHKELLHLAPALLTTRLYYHYRGFFTNQEKLYNNIGAKRVKGLLYRYRIALTGIRVLETGILESNLALLNEDYKSPLVKELIAMKVNGEAAFLEDDKPYLAEIETLRPRLDIALAGSKLPQSPDAKTVKAVQDLVVRIRKS